MSLDAPETAPAGSRVAVKWTGPGDKNDVIGIVPANAPDKAHAQNNDFLFAANPVHLTVPEEPGDYELRYYDHSSGAPLARRKLKILPVTATLDAPATAVSGTSFAVRWTGPNNESDTIGVVPAGAPERSHYERL